MLGLRDRDQQTGRRQIAPLVLLPIELTVSNSVLAVAAAITGERRLPAANRAALAWLNPGLAYAFGLAGLALISASASAVLWAIEPILIILLAWAALRPRPGFPRWPALRRR